MRDILNDLEPGRHLSDPDPTRRAQLLMKTPLPKRFYSEATVEPGEGGFAVETVVERRGINVLIPALKDAGASDIIELPLTKIVH